MEFKLPALDYAYDALEPHIDRQTMEIHHTRHHAAYINNLNNAVKDTPLVDQDLEDLLMQVSKLPPAVRNNGGGHYNHSLFWQTIGPNAGGTPGDSLGQAITDSFGSFDGFKEQFEKQAVGRFGSGWAWLIVQDNTLKLTSTPNQDNPLMDVAEQKGMPLLGLDVWEHAYYLKYQNRRPDYVKAFWNVVNWEKVQELYRKARLNQYADLVL